MDRKKYYRQIPKVDILLESRKISEAVELYGKEQVLQTIHEVEEEIRQMIGGDAPEEELEKRIECVEDEMISRLEKAGNIILRE